MDYVNQTLVKTHAAAIFNAAIATVEPGACVNRFLIRDNDLLMAGGHQLSLKDFTKIIVVGAGKAAAAMARAVELILGDKISGGLVITKYGHGDSLKNIELREAGHPIPDENGLLASRELLQLVEDADEKTLILCLLSGGGSALLIQPEAGITLQDKQKVSGLLMECGATIHEINTIRKKLSRIKGGGLRRAAGKAQVVSLVL